ncbi:MAG: hypothetical protein US96_C0005G0005 [Candidatus Woesebacteria bacterium GW2011_GWB1_38_5b]|uniref:DUF6311 domain-containing protein n=1 Tax=Candidatus Woesebacteria bacterium GW2011_GWB1_38_5b TaxID=1618569 RepID=A0A0G0KA83_9BACT|nr:MAG: hypothetical protein US96_C0005G0005 [Candidatus Woesebacteria bacterium GW2011_GWB1_38_5b]
MIKNGKFKHVLFLIAFLITFGVIFRDLLINISTNFPDWRDYPYLTWIINENIYHLRSLDFSNLFNLNVFYPHTNTLFLSDTLITQSLIGLPFSFFTKNPVLIFNLVFFLTFLLNYIAAYILFNKLLKNSLLSFIGGLAIVFSPFFYTQMGHFQMQNYWPFIFILYFLFKTDKKKFSFNEVLIGLLVATQFLASVYLAFFSIISIFIFFLVKIYKGQNYKVAVSKFSIIILTFLLLDGIFIKGYMDAKKSFEIKRGVGEYLTYSAKISDYFFPRQNGLFYQNSLVAKWQSYNKHFVGETASFPGFILTILGILGLIKFGKSKEHISFNFSTDTPSLFFLCLMIIGFIFSLGYPYIPFAKYVPFFDTIRGVSRWSFLLYVGIAFFAVFYISKIKSKWLFTAALVLLITDVLPAKFITYKDSYLEKNDETLRTICTAKKTVLFELPVTHFDAGDNIAKGLSYIAKRELASVYNSCHLVNGYSGYDLPNLFNFKDQVYAAINSADPKLLYNVVKGRGVNVVKVNTEYLNETSLENYNKIYSKFSKLEGVREIGNNLFLIE